MDPISAATGIIGLFSTCRDCYLFFSKLNNADNDMRFMIDDLDIEAAFLKSWGCYWGIHPPGLSSSPKLEDYLKKNPYKQYGVAKILLRIGELMTDDEELLTRYGVKLMLRDGQRMDKRPKINDFRIPFKDELQILKNFKDNKNAMRKRMGLLNRCRWTILGGRDDFFKLLETLRQYNKNLYRFCPEGAGVDLNRFCHISFLDSHHEPLPLRMVSEQTDRLVQREEDPSIKEGLELLRDMMRLKGKAGFYNTKPVTESERHALLKYRPEMLSFRREEESSTIAELNESSKSVSMVYVEFKSYRDDTGAKDQDHQDDILKLGRLMLYDEASYRLNTMGCLGLFKDSRRGRIGFIFRLPSPLEKPLAHWDAYEPYRLLDFLKDGTHPFELGRRFDLAKTLVDNVIRLHTVGWLHKNIRSESILFFPQSLKKGERGYYGPYFMGYDFIRIEIDRTPDDIHDKDSNRRHPSRLVEIARGEDHCPDIYHHPDKRNSPGRVYQYAYDIYSLGLLLIEIGLWQPLHRIVRGREHSEPHSLREYIIGKVDNELAAACGLIYTKVVRTFLTMTSKSSLDAMKRQRDTCAKMASELSRCVV